MSCEVMRGDAADTVRFSRSGVSGELQVRADRFELTAQLGFLLGAFSHKIQHEIEHNLDSLLAHAGAVPPAGTPVKPADGRAAAKRAPSRRGPRTRG